MKVGDVVFTEGASAILGDVVAVDEDEGLVTVTWRKVTTTEDADDLTLDENESRIAESFRMAQGLEP